MLELFFKVFKTPKNITAVKAKSLEQLEIHAVGKKIQSRVNRLFKGSLAIRQIDAGSDNACEQELSALTNPFYDIERFGIHFVASPKHADMLLVTGPVTRNMAEAVQKAYAATPEPKLVVAVGDDALHGGVYRQAYAVLDGVDAVIPVDYQIPGDPPTPMTILYHLLKILESLDNKTLKKR